MITQGEVDRLLKMVKKIINGGIINFPTPGDYSQIEIVSVNGKEKFLIDINRKGKIKISKCTYQERYRKDIILLRIDIDGPPHTNPDGRIISSNHIHIYKEGFGESWAYPLPSDIFTDTSDLIGILIEFLQYCKVENIHDIKVLERMI